MILDFGVAQRLGDGGVVDFTVAVAAVTDEVDDHIGVEGVAVFDGQRGDTHDGVGVFRVHVEDGDGQPLARCRRRSARNSTRPGSAVKPMRLLTMIWMVPPTVKPWMVGEIQGFCPDALAGKGGVAVDEHRAGRWSMPRLPKRICLARARPMATGSTASR